MISPFAPASTFAGSYRIVDAIGTDGVAYRGTAVIQPMGMFGHVIAHIDGQPDRHGLAALFEGRLLIAWGPKDKVEIGAYRVVHEELLGVWVPPGATGDDLSACGIEVSRSMGTDQWEIQRAHAIDQLPYTGQLSIKSAGPGDVGGYQRVDLSWALNDGVYTSFALRRGPFMVSTFSFEPEKPYAISVYELGNNTLIGHQIWKDQPRAATERWERAM